MNAFITEASKKANVLTHNNAIAAASLANGTHQSPSTDPLDILATEWLEAKEAEKLANERRKEIEADIISLVGVAEEGTTNGETEHYKIETVGKLTRSLNDSQLQADWDTLPDEIKKCVKWKTSLDTKNLRSLESMRDDLIPVMSRYLTTKPAKPSVVVEAK